MKNKNKILALAISASFIFVAPSVSWADDLSIEAIGIDNNDKEFNYDAVPNKEIKAEIIDWDTDEVKEELTLDESTENKKTYTPEEDADVILEVDETDYDDKKVYTDLGTDDARVIQLFNPELKVDGLSSEDAKNINGMVYWDANEEAYNIDFGTDKELKYNDDRLDENELRYRNRTPMIYIDGKPTKAGKVLVNDPKTGELVFNLDENGNPNYTLVEGENGELKFVEKLDSDAINGTTIKFANANESGADERSKEDLDDLYGEKNKDSVKMIDVEVDFEVIERENPDLAKGEKKLAQEGKKGKSIIYIYPDDSEDNPHREIKVVSEPVDEIWEIGSKEEEIITPTPLEPSEEIDPCKEDEIPLTPLEPSEEIDPCEEEEIPLTPLEPAEEIDPCEKEEIPLIPLKPAEKVIPAPVPNGDPDDIDIPSIHEIPSDEDDIEIIDPIYDLDVDEDKPVVIGNDDEKKAKDLTDKLNKITKEIKDTLIANEKEIAKEDKEEVKPSDDNKEEASKEEKKEKDEKEDKKEKKDNTNQAVRVPKVSKKAKAIKAAKKSTNPKTGVAGIGSILASLSLASAGLFASKKRK